MRELGADQFSGRRAGWRVVKRLAREKAAPVLGFVGVGSYSQFAAHIGRALGGNLCLGHRVIPSLLKKALQFVVHAPPFYHTESARQWLGGSLRLGLRGLCRQIRHRANLLPLRLPFAPPFPSGGKASANGRFVNRAVESGHDLIVNRVSHAQQESGTRVFDRLRVHDFDVGADLFADIHSDLFYKIAGPRLLLERRDLGHTRQSYQNRYGWSRASRSAQ